jgi:acetyl esterase/lipase
MASIAGNIFKFFIGRDNLSSSDVVQKIQKSTSSQINDRVPRGFVFTRERTPNGTVYERLTRKGAKKTGRVIYYCHGGGYVGGLLSFYRGFVKDFCDAVDGCEVIMIDYKCSPEYIYPTQQTEALDLWEDLTQRQGYAPENIIIGGDSAGGNLALSMMLKLRDTGNELPCAAFCISVWGDLTGSGKSFTENYHKDIMFGSRTGEVSEAKRLEALSGGLYVFAGDRDRTDPYISPVYGDYKGFPPMFFTVGGDEMLLDDTLTIVDKLRECGVDVDCDVQPEMFHIYTVFRNLMPESRESYARLLSFMRTNLVR